MARDPRPGSARALALGATGPTRVTAVTRYAIDAATLVHLVSNDVTVDASHQLVAPGSLRSQALDLLLERVRAGDLGEREAMVLHERLTRTKVRLLGDRVSRGTAWQIAREREWPSIRDAEHLAVAKLQADALVSVDPELVAKAEGVVPLAPVEALSVP
jgi:predicted nucleic acid-binding protein